MTPRDIGLQVTVHGPAVTEDDAREVGQQMANLLNEVGRAVTGEPLGITVGEVAFRCDGCGRRQPFDAPRDGWTHHEGDDFCPECTDAR